MTYHPHVDYFPITSHPVVFYFSYTTGNFQSLKDMSFFFFICLWLHSSWNVHETSYPLDYSTYKQSFLHQPLFSLSLEVNNKRTAYQETTKRKRFRPEDIPVAGNVKLKLYLRPSQSTDAQDPFCKCSHERLFTGNFISTTTRVFNRFINRLRLDTRMPQNEPVNMNLCQQNCGINWSEPSFIKKGLVTKSGDKTLEVLAVNP